MAKLSKAIAGGFAGFTASVATSASDGKITKEEWLIAVAAFIGAAYVVWQAPKNAE